MKAMASKSTLKIPAQAYLWGIIHGLNDLMAGYMLANFALSHNSEQTVSLLMLYGIIAFGGQLPLAFLADRIRSVKPFARTSVVLLFISISLYPIDPGVAIVVTAIAGAGIHVTGGTICLQLSDKASVLGIFTSPGVLGLTIGGVIANIATWPLVITALGVFVVGFKILQSDIPDYQAKVKNEKDILDSHDWIMLGILLLMCFRSFVFDLINLAGQQFGDTGLMILGASAFGGKLIGGFMADRFGNKKTIYAGLLLAFVFLQFSHDNLYTLAFGIACLQSSVPLTLLLMARSLPFFPATASGLSLGVSVAISGLPLFVMSVDTNSILLRLGSWGIILMVILIMTSLIIWLKKKYSFNTFGKSVIPNDGHDLRRL